MSYAQYIHENLKKKKFSFKNVPYIKKQSQIN